MDAGPVFKEMKLEAVLRGGMMMAAALLLLAAAGCGVQTDEANRLFLEADEMLATSAQPKLNQSEALLAQATTQSAQDQKAAAMESLSRARSLIDEAAPEVEAARSKIDRGASLNISDSHRRFLKARSRVLEAVLALEETRRSAVAVLLADPAVEKPETLSKMAELRKIESEQVQILKEAEDEARRVAAESQEDAGG